MRLPGGDRSQPAALVEASTRCAQWLDDLKGDPLAQAAFGSDDWNTYRIECIGDHLRVSVNGIPTADLVDGGAARGVFAFQVHSGKQGVIHWRNPRLWSFEDDLEGSHRDARDRARDARL